MFKVEHLRTKGIWKNNVPPGYPSIDAIEGPFVEGADITLRCRGYVGRPAVKLSWSRHRVGQSGFRNLVDGTRSNLKRRHDDGTSSAVCELRVRVSAEDDGAVFRCVAKAGVNELPDDKKISVLYPPRNSKIEFDAVNEKCFCHAEGNPEPSYSWLWLRTDGKRTVVSATQYLDMLSFPNQGLLRFRCIVSNVINKTQYTSVLEIRMHVSNPPVEIVEATIETATPVNGQHPSRVDVSTLDYDITNRTTVHREASVEGPAGTPKASKDRLYYKNAVDDGNINDIYLGIADDDEFVNQENGVKGHLMRDIENEPRDVPRNTKMGINYDKPSTSMLSANLNDEVNNNNNSERPVYTNVDITLDYQVSSDASSKSGSNNQKSENTSYSTNDGMMIDKEDAKSLPDGMQTMQAIRTLDGEPNYGIKANIDRKTHFGTIGLQTIQSFAQATTMNKFAKDGGYSDLNESKESPNYDGHESIQAFARVEKTATDNVSNKPEQRYRDIHFVSNRNSFSLETGFTRRHGNLAENEQDDTNKVGRRGHDVINGLDTGSVGYQTIQAFADATQKERNDKKNEDTIKLLMKTRQTLLDASPNYGVHDIPVGGSFHGGWLRTKASEDVLKIGPDINTNHGVGDVPENTDVNIIERKSDAPITLHIQDAHQINQTQYVYHKHHAYKIYQKTISGNANGVLSTNGDRKNQDETNRKTHSFGYSEDRTISQAAVDGEVHSSGGHQRQEREGTNENQSNQYEIVTTVSSDEFDCTRRSDGVYGGGCRTFYRCLNHQRFRVQCRPSYVLNEHSGRCDRRGTATTPCGVRRNCSEKADGMYGDNESNCRFYYSCFNGTFLGHNACGKGLIFNEAKQICDWPKNVSPPCGQNV